MSTDPLEISDLPPDKRQEVLDFIEFLRKKDTTKTNVMKKPTFGWMGALKEYKDKYTSLELQKKAFEWRD